MTEDRPPIVAAIIVHAKRVLLVRRRISEGSLSWQFPAGEMESGETAFQTAVREVAEEVGIFATPIELIGHREHPVTGRQMIYVACETDTDGAALLDTEDLVELTWASQDEVVDKIPTGIFGPVADYLFGRLVRVECYPDRR